MDYKQNVIDFYKIPTTNYFDYEGAAYISMFKKLPQCYQIYYNLLLAC